MNSPAEQLILKFHTEGTTHDTAVNYALIHVENILRLPIIWSEKGSEWESRFGSESTEEYWLDLKKEINKLIR